MVAKPAAGKPRPAVQHLHEATSSSGSMSWRHFTDGDAHPDDSGSVTSSCCLRAAGSARCQTGSGQHQPARSHQPDRRFYARNKLTGALGTPSPARCVLSKQTAGAFDQQ